MQTFFYNMFIYHRSHHGQGCLNREPRVGIPFSSFQSSGKCPRPEIEHPSNSYGNLCIISYDEDAAENAWKYPNRVRIIKMSRVLLLLNTWSSSVLRYLASTKLWWHANRFCRTMHILVCLCSCEDFSVMTEESGASWAIFHFIIESRLPLWCWSVAKHQ